MKITKCLAYMWPAEDIQGKDIALANVKFITGPYERKTARYMEEGRSNLRKNDYTVDYIITHCCSTSTQIALGGAGIYEADRQTDYLEFIKNYANYKKWFFGHYHENKNVNDKEILIYEQMIRIS